MISEVGLITLLSWEGDLKIGSVKLFIDPKINGMFIDEELLKKHLNSISSLNCMENLPFEIPIKLEVPNKVPEHSFYLTIIPSEDFPENFRKEGFGLILGKSWIDLIDYPLK